MVINLIKILSREVEGQGPMKPGNQQKQWCQFHRIVIFGR